MVTIGEGKHYCLGLDLDYLSTAPADHALRFSDNLQKLLLRILTFPLVTVAAINGESISIAYSRYPLLPSPPLI